MTTLDSNDPRPRSERLYEIVRERILTADLKPGDVVIEPELAQEYSVSRTPARETLRMLVAEGWLDALPRKGYVVRSLSVQDVRDVMDLRLVIEPAFAAAAARLSTPALVEELRALVDEQSRTTDLSELLRLAAALHLRIGAASGNRRVGRVLRPLVDEINRLHHLDEHVRAHVSSAAELAAHRAVVDAIAAGDADAARAAMHDHLQEARVAMFASR